MATKKSTPSVAAQATEEALSAAVQILQAKEDALAGQSTTLATEGDAPIVTAGNEQPTDMPAFDELLGALSQDDKLEAAKRINDQFDARLATLARLKPNNMTQGPKLENYRKKLAMPSKAAVLVAAGTDPAFINRPGPGEEFYNIYAIDKVIDVVEGLAGGAMKNAINRAITRSLFAFKREGIAFTGEHAKACVSDKIRITDKTIKSVLVQHTASTGTASTQSSSTMQALQTLGIVVNKGSQKFPVYEILDTPQARKMAQIVAAA